MHGLLEVADPLAEVKSESLLMNPGGLLMTFLN
jgi:hypothetical protein